LVFDDDVRFEGLLDTNSLVDQWDRHLACDGQAPFLKFIGQQGLVNALVKSGSEAAVNSESRIDNNPRNLIVGHGVLPLRSLRVHLGVFARNSCFRMTDRRAVPATSSPLPRPV